MRTTAEALAAMPGDRAGALEGEMEAGDERGTEKEERAGAEAGERPRREYERPTLIEVPPVDEKGFVNWDYPVPWGLKHVFWVIVLTKSLEWYFTNTIPSIVFLPTPGQNPLSLPENILRTAIVLVSILSLEYIAILVWTWDFLWIRSLPIQFMIGNAVSRRLLSLSATMGIFLWIVSVISAQKINEHSVSVKVPGVEITNGALFIIICIMGPISEEFFFRGIVYRVLREKVGLTGACIGASILFTLCHLKVFEYPQLAIGMMAFGIATAVLYERTRSLIPSILIHITNNLFGFFLAVSWHGR